jgi:phage terminase large subunit-like protein
MPSVANYQNDRAQRAKSISPIIRLAAGGKSLSETMTDKKRERMKRWITFFRQNPHIFIEKYFGIKLYPYQILMIWMLNNSSTAYIVASRATGKSWIIAVWSLTLAVLYPGIKIVICAKTLKQGGLILSEKLKELIDMYPNVAREVKKLQHNQNDYVAEFHCGSNIKVVSATENSRGKTNELPQYVVTHI